MGIIQEFKKFAMRGNAVDLAVGIIIGSAFGKIVNSLVNDILMPPLGIIIGSMDFSQYAITLKHAPDGSSAASIKYGSFISTTIDFLIVSFAIFILIKGINSLKKKEEAAAPPPPKESKEEIILAEIRDILKSK